jgi:high affinity Mn2+ porin
MRAAGIASVLTGALLASNALADGTNTAQVEMQEAVRPSSWNGLYFGGHISYASGGSDWTARSPLASTDGSFEFFRSFDAFKGTGSYSVGLQGGYNYRLPSGIIIGVEADLTGPNTLTSVRTISSPTNGQAGLAETVEMSGTVNARIGFVGHDWLFYATAGYAWSYDQFLRSQLFGIPVGGTAIPGATEKASAWRSGLGAGAGIEVPVAAKWTASLEYMFTGFGAQGVTFPAGAQRVDSDLTKQSLRLGLNYQFGDGFPTSDRGPTPPKSDIWSVHTQTTFTQQYALPFSAPYRGPNSLDSNAGRETWDTTFYLGARLWPGAELWFNPEIDQGFGLSETLGVAGFPSAEAYKVGQNFPYARLPRYFIRQTIGLGEETEKIEDAANQFGGTQSKDRIVITAGKFSAVDIFDANKYAHDPHSDFLNWAIVDAATFDYAADAWAFTYGMAVEWYRGPWALRFGLFDLPIVPNSTDLDPTFKQFQWISEIERRYTLWGNPGRVAVTGFLTEGSMGRYDDALQFANVTGQTPALSAVRRFQSRTGISFNVEQQLSADIGFFARGGWADGTVEQFAFTDVDRTFAAGFSIAGTAWGHKDHTLGVAGVINGISAEHQAYLNAGGLTALLGDGKLPHPGPEEILEAYYSIPISIWRVTGDYQYIQNPGYNEDRGPVSVIALRVHSQF